jgi:hypothetical protein
MKYAELFKKSLIIGFSNIISKRVRSRAVKFKLKGKMVSGGLIIVIFSMLISTVIISMIIKKQSRDEAIRFLHRAFAVIEDDLENRKTRIMKQVLQLGSHEDVVSLVNFYMENKSNPDLSSTIESQNLDFVKKLYEILQLGNLRNIAVYDMDGELVGFAAMAGNKTYIGYPFNDSNRQTYKIASVQKGEQISLETFSFADQPRGIKGRHEKKVLARGYVKYEAFDNLMCFVSNAPVTANDYVTEKEEVVTVKKQVGFVTSSKIIGESLLNRLSSLTGTRINLSQR